MSKRGLPLESFIKITVSDDKLTAYLEFILAEEELVLSVFELEQYAASKGVVYGLDRAKLASIADNPKVYVLMKSVIATGDKPVDGRNGYVLFLYDLDNKEKRPLELDDGKVNYKEITALNNIKKGHMIARKIPPEPSQDGLSVTGETLQAKAGKEAVFKIGKNVVQDLEQACLYAAIDGMVTKTERDKINVFPIYEVNGDVDFHVGNIDFIGSVIIRGSVQPGFRIKAEGDICVTGGVEAAELEAGGSVDIRTGVVGQNKAKLKAGKSIKSSFIQDALVEAKEDIIVLQSIMHSTIRAGRAVVCNGPKGLIVGGIVQAGERVTTRTVGNSMSTVTVIEVGVLPELRNELIELRKELRMHLDHLDKTVKALMLLDQLAATGQLGPEKLSLRLKLNQTKKQSADQEVTLRERILEIENILEDSDKARLETIATIYSGTKIVIGRYTKFVKDAVSNVVFYLSDGDIAMTSYV